MLTGMHGKPKRRWLRFSVRTLLVAVSILCVWMGWQVSIVRERKAVRHLMNDRLANVRFLEDSPYSDWADDPELIDEFQLPQPVNWFRRLLNDTTAVAIGLDTIPAWFTPEERERVRKAFPEAKISGLHGKSYER